MRLNEDWDQVYRSATLSLQQRMAALELENTAVKELNSRLLLRLKHQQVRGTLNETGTGKVVVAGGDGGFLINAVSDCY